MEKTQMPFLSCEVRWGLLGKITLIILGIMLVFYAAGFCLNDGPSMNYLGWVYWTDWGELPEVGEIFRFAPANRPAWTKWLPHSTWIKRCTAITPEGYVFEGDNTEWSLDQRELGRDVMAPVPASHISGTVWAAFHPRRVARWFTSRGRLENWVSITQGTNFQFEKTHWGWFGRNGKRWVSSNGKLVTYGSGYAVLCNGSIVEVKLSSNGCRLLSGDGQRVIAVLPEPIRQDLAGVARKIVASEKSCFILGQESVWVLDSKGNDFLFVSMVPPEGNALIVGQDGRVWVTDIMAPTPVFLQEIGGLLIKKR